MTITARREYMKDTQVRYQRAENRKQKSRIISEVVNPVRNLCFKGRLTKRFLIR
jgi:hypothetical protein